MDKAQLQVRAENRRKWAQTADSQNSLVAEIGTAWLQQAATKWNPEVQPKVPDGIPVGPDFILFVKRFMKQNGFRTLEFGDGAVRAGAEAVASWIDYNGTRIVGIDFPNPLTEISKAKGEGFIVASNTKQTKTAQQHTIYGPIERERIGIYAEPDEWTRYCPEHPGVMMRRVKDGLYQCPMKGEVFSYTDGHDVEHFIGVQNQTNPNWNDTWPQKGFLDTPNQQSTRASGGTYDEDSTKEHPKYTKNKDITHKSHTPDLYANEGAMKGKKEKKEASFKPFMKKAEESLGIADKLFGATTMNSRYCPDHPGTSLYRIADSVFQCPLDRAIYDYERGFTTQDGKEHSGGTVAEMTPNWPEFYESPHPFLMKGNVRSFIKTSQKISKLRPFQNDAAKWADRKYPLDQAKEEFKKMIETAFAGDEKSIRENLKGMEEAKTAPKLLQHFYNLIVGYEGDKVIKTRGSLDKKAFGNLEYRFVHDVELAMRGDEKSKRVLGLVVDGTLHGKPLAQAIQEAYDFIEKSERAEPKQPGTIEVQEEPGMTPGVVPPPPPPSVPPVGVPKV